MARSGWAQDSIPFDWLVALFPTWSRITADTAGAAAAGAMAVLARSGCTTVGDHHYIFPRGSGDIVGSIPREAGLALHPAELLFSATLAGARALDMEHAFGNLDVGKDADFLLIDTSRWEPLAAMLDMGIRSDDEEQATLEELFTLLIGLRQPAIAEVYVQGQRATAPPLD